MKCLPVVLSMLSPLFAADLLLVHGWTCDRTFWKTQIEGLHPHRVVAIDLPGHGSNALGAISPTAFADAVHEAIQKNGLNKPVLVGHSMGGLVIRHYAKMHPENVSGLVVVDSPIAFTDTPAMRAWANGFAGENGAATRRKMITGMFVPATSDAVREEILSKMLAAPERTAVEAARWMVVDATSLGSFSGPALVVVKGSTPADLGEKWRAVLPRSRFVALPGTGHFLMMEKPAEFNALVREFVESLNFGNRRVL